MEHLSTIFSVEPDTCKAEKEIYAGYKLTSVAFWRTADALYPSCKSIASAAFRLATFLLGPVPVVTSLFTLTCMYTHFKTQNTK